MSEYANKYCDKDCPHLIEGSIEGLLVAGCTKHLNALRRPRKNTGQDLWLRLEICRKEMEASDATHSQKM